VVAAVAVVVVLLALDGDTNRVGEAGRSVDVDDAASGIALLLDGIASAGLADEGDGLLLALLDGGRVAAHVHGLLGEADLAVLLLNSGHLDRLLAVALVAISSTSSLIVLLVGLAILLGLLVVVLAVRALLAVLLALLGVVAATELVEVVGDRV